MIKKNNSTWNYLLGDEKSSSYETFSITVRKFLRIETFLRDTVSWQGYNTNFDGKEHLNLFYFMFEKKRTNRNRTTLNVKWYLSEYFQKKKQTFYFNFVWIPVHSATIKIPLSVEQEFNQGIPEPWNMTLSMK